MNFTKRSLFAVLFSFALFIVSCKKENPAPGPGPTPPPTGGGGGGGGSTNTTGDDNNLLLGNPTNATASTASMDNYFIDHTYYAEGYSNSRGIPLWVSWHLQSSDIGSAPRQNDFRPDNLLPSGFYLVQSNSYSGSGFDRGHNCPSADRTSTVAANSSTFFMTNMIPQAPYFNQGPWGNLENYIRTTLVGTGNEAFIVMGAYGQGGVASSSVVNTINNGYVTVPKKVFKIAVILPKASNDLSRIDTTVRILAVNMPNDNRLYSTNSTGQLAWKNYVTTLAAIEQDAANEGFNYDLLRNISDAMVKNYLKQKPSVH